MASEPKPPAVLPAFPLDAYYDSNHKSYLVKDRESNWMPVNERGINLHLENAGHSRTKAKGTHISRAELAILRIQRERNIIYAGPLAGYDAGLHYQGGYKLLVTHSPIYIHPAGTDWSLIQAIIDGMFEAPDCHQADYFHLWLKVAEQAFRTKNFTPGPALAIAGPARCGKTLLATIITEILGGRCASPYRYMMANTTFNRDMIGAEHLIVDDEAASKDLRCRRAFGNQIKTSLFAGVQSGHGKQENATCIKPFWRLSILLNDEPENLLVLPPIDESLEDKIMLLKSALRPMPMPTDTPETRAAFWAAIQAQIPAYIGWLRSGFKTPAHFRVDSRTGVVAYKHPVILAELSALSPEYRLLILIDNVLFMDSYRIWEGTAEQLTKELCNSEYAFEAKRLLDWSNATGTYLGRLARLYPDRVKDRRTADSREWEIHAKCEPITAPYHPQAPTGIPEGSLHAKFDETPLPNPLQQASMTA